MHPNGNGTTLLRRVYESLTDRDGPRVREAAARQMLRGTVREVQEALGTAYFDSITLDVATNALVKGHSAWPAAWPFIASPATVNDFKNVNRTSVSAFKDLDTVLENEPYKPLTLGDFHASYAAQKRGNTFALTMEAEFNDQIGAFARNVESFGVAAARTVDRFVVTTKLSADPALSLDGLALFHANHNNDANTGGAPTLANIKLAIAKMLAQVGWDEGTGTTPEVLFMPKTLLVGPADLVEAREAVNSTEVVTGEAVTRGSINMVKQFLQDPVPTPFLTGATGSAKWYLLADPATTPMFELGFLGGRQVPEVMKEVPNSGYDFEHDAHRIKARIVFGGDWLDWRGVVLGL